MRRRGLNRQTVSALVVVVIGLFFGFLIFNNVLPTAYQSLEDTDSTPTATSRQGEAASPSDVGDTADEAAPEGDSVMPETSETGANTSATTRLGYACFASTVAILLIAGLGVVAWLLAQVTALSIRFLLMISQYVVIVVTALVIIIPDPSDVVALAAIAIGGFTILVANLRNRATRQGGALAQFWKDHPVLRKSIPIVLVLSGAAFAGLAVFRRPTPENTAQLLFGLAMIWSAVQTNGNDGEGA